MIAIPLEFEFTAREAAAGATLAKAKQDARTSVLLGYLNQIRAAYELGETSLVTTCMHHEVAWLSQELRERGFDVDASTQLMHGKLAISWESRA